MFAALARADLFVLASKKAADGDQDGLPNVLMEAAHQGLAIVSTHAAAIGEFITDGDNGLLVAPGAPDELATALARLVARSRPAPASGAAGPSEIVRTRFSFDAGVDWIATALGQTLLRIPRHRGPATRGTSRGVTDMRVLLHTPLKPPDSATPSGDREMARGLVAPAAPPRPYGGDAGAEPRGARRAGGRRASRARAPRARGRRPA